MDKKSVDYWQDRLENEETVVLVGTLETLHQMASAEETSANELADVILKDPALTTQVIRIANTVHFNPAGVPLTTVSRAIMHVGFNTIRSICVSIKVMETFLKGNATTLIVDLISRSLHGATQAKRLISHMAQEKQEEVFIASMLLHLSELLVLSAQDLPESVVLCERITESMAQQEREKVAEEILGISFKRMTQGLAKHWHMGGLIADALAGGRDQSDQAKAVVLGDQIARVLKKGWQANEIKILLPDIKKLTGKDEPEVKSMIEEASEEAAEVAVKYGSKELVKRLAANSMGLSSVEPDISAANRLEPDQKLQLQVLQELTSAMLEGADMNAMFQLVLEGLHRGVGLERVALGIFDRDRRMLRVKFVLGKGTEHWREGFTMVLENHPANMLKKVFATDAPAWIGNAEGATIGRTQLQALPKITQVDEFLVAPLSLKGIPVGVLYADLGETERPLTAEYFAGFKHFAQQAGMYLTVIAARPKPKADARSSANK